MDHSLGSLKKLNLRSLWTNEATELTPWLATDDNIAILGEALGLELEVENTEVAVGPYSADILAKDIGTDTYIVIENQLEKTNHDHLGKLITYASVLEASAIVWIASNFTDEHKKALDWLNDHTTEDVAFYGVALEVWQIDESKPAVRFNVICRPAEVIRQALISKSSDSLTENRKMQLEFWTAFREKLMASKKLPSVRLPRPRYWYDIPLGKSYIHLSCFFNTTANRIGVRVYISAKIAEAALSHFQDKKEDIEKEIGQKLEWDLHPNNRDKIIALRKSADVENRSRWPEYLDWMFEYTFKFRDSFGKRIRGVKFDSHDDSDESTE